MSLPWNAILPDKYFLDPELWYVQRQLPDDITHSEKRKICSTILREYLNIGKAHFKEVRKSKEILNKKWDDAIQKLHSLADPNLEPDEDLASRHALFLDMTEDPDPDLEEPKWHARWEKCCHDVVKWLNGEFEEEDEKDRQEFKKCKTEHANQVKEDRVKMIGEKIRNNHDEVTDEELKEIGFVF